MDTSKYNLIGQTLGTCILEKLIGQGGMGSVYLAKQTRPLRNVAVKVLMPNIATNDQDHQEFLARFRREANVIAKLEHINIMPIYEYGEQDGLAYLVMPYITGGSLREILAERGKLPIDETISYIDQATAALDYAHAYGIVHRDLKPANFLLHADGRLILADFGIARILEDDSTVAGLTSTGALLGTPEYMAPEMARGESLDYRADIYELGVVLYQMLSGHVPFTSNSAYAIIAQHVQEPLPLLHLTNPAISPDVDAVIQKATAKNPNDRYQSGRNMAQALRTASAASFFAREDSQAYLPTVLSRALLSHSAQQSTAPDITSPSYTNPVGTLPRLSSPMSMTVPNRQPRSAPFRVVLAILLIIGGIFLGIQFNGTIFHINVPSNPTPTIGTPQLTTNPATTVTQPTSTSTTTSTIPVGALLYTTANPGQNCDTNGGQWADYSGVQIICQNANSTIVSTSSTYLQGTFLTRLPGQTYPTNYVVQVQLQQNKNSFGDFGIYFRNQPGSQLGANTLLIHPDGSWSAYVYNNQTGAPTQLTGGNFGNTYVPMTLAVVVNGPRYSFYANNHFLGSAVDPTYASGTAGIVVGHGCTLTVSNFWLYEISA